MKRSTEMLTECARLVALDFWPHQIAPKLNVSLRTVHRWLARSDVQDLIRTNGDRFRRDERRRLNAIERTKARSKVNGGVSRLSQPNGRVSGILRTS